MLSSSEVWRPIVGYEGVYDVSDRGRVRRVAAGQGARPGIRRPSTHPNGYQQVVLSMNNVQSTKKVHRLVLEAFVGPCPVGMEALHADDDGRNNSLENLRWGTHRENCDERERNGKPKRPAPLRVACSRGHVYPGDCELDGRGYRICPTCRTEKNLRARATVDGYCRKGHEMTGENTYTDPRGREHCRECRRAADRRRGQTRAHKHGKVM